MWRILDMWPILDFLFQTRSEILQDQGPEVKAVFVFKNSLTLWSKLAKNFLNAKKALIYRAQVGTLGISI